MEVVSCLKDLITKSKILWDNHVTVKSYTAFKAPGWKLLTLYCKSKLEAECVLTPPQIGKRKISEIVQIPRSSPGGVDWDTLLFQCILKLWSSISQMRGNWWNSWTVLNFLPKNKNDSGHMGWWVKYGQIDAEGQCRPRRCCFPCCVTGKPGLLCIAASTWASVWT